MPRSHTHAVVDSPQDECFGFRRLSQRKSTLILFERHGNLKYKYGSRSFWCRGYYVDTAGKNTKKIAEYIRGQLKEDQIEDQMTLKEYTGPLA